MIHFLDEGVKVIKDDSLENVCKIKLNLNLCFEDPINVEST